MARAGNGNIKGSVKIDIDSAGDPVFAVLGDKPTNNGSFKTIERTGVGPGKFVITMNETAQLSPDDIIEPTIDEAGADLAGCNAEHVDQATFKVTTSDGVLFADQQFGVVIYEQLKG